MNFMGKTCISIVICMVEGVVKVGGFHFGVRHLTSAK
jgi:hypothetical protein